MRHRLLLFLVSCFLGGLGGVLGSIVGNAGGKGGWFVGASSVDSWVRQVEGLSPVHVAGFHAPPPSERASGAAVGFLAAALIATQTPGSPIGPVLSTSLIGLGALAGAGRRHDQVV